MIHYVYKALTAACGKPVAELTASEHMLQDPKRVTCPGCRKALQLDERRLICDTTTCRVVYFKGAVGSECPACKEPGR